MVVIDWDEKMLLGCFEWLVFESIVFCDVMLECFWGWLVLVFGCFLMCDGSYSWIVIVFLVVFGCLGWMKIVIVWDLDLLVGCCNGYLMIGKFILCS